MAEPPKYASSTKVPIERTKYSIEDELMKYGASGFGYATKGTFAIIGFVHNNRQYRLYLPLPQDDDPPDERAVIAFTKHNNVSREQVRKNWKHYEEKRRWRALYLVIKAKLIAIADGITSLEKEFFADVVTPDGTTMYEYAEPKIQKMIADGRQPDVGLLGGHEPRRLK